MVWVELLNLLSEFCMQHVGNQDSPYTGPLIPLDGGLVGIEVFDLTSDQLCKVIESENATQCKLTYNYF